MSFEDELGRLFSDAVDVLVTKGYVYGDSWKKRGGIGAFMMLARKWDRIERSAQAHNWDIFRAIDLADHTLLEDIMDLRNYLTLVEHEVICGRRKRDSDADFTPDSQESPGDSPEGLGVGDNGNPQESRRVPLMSTREFDKA